MRPSHQRLLVVSLITSSTLCTATLSLAVPVMFRSPALTEFVDGAVIEAVGGLVSALPVLKLIQVGGLW